MPIGGARLWAAAAAGAAAALFALGFCISPSVEAPPHALVQVDMESRVYFSPPCRQISSGYGVATLENARTLGLTPDPVCVDEGGFVQKNRSLSGQLLEALGLLAPHPHRWNPNGSWNW